MQATLFGKARPKESLFPNIRTGDSPYFAVVEALWHVEKSRSTSEFLKFAQAEWTKTYRDDASARAALFTRVKSLKAKLQASDDSSAVKPFVTILSPGEALRRREEEATAERGASCRAAAAVEESKAGTSTDHALGCGSLLEVLLRSFEVSPGDLLTDEVRGKLTLMNELEDLAKVWLVHEEERKAYERNSSFNWKKINYCHGT